MTMPRRDSRPYTSLARRIASAREAARLSQPELADRAHISVSYMGMIEMGARRPSPEILKALARELEIDYDEELAPLAGYNQRTQGDAVVRVPAEEAADTRWFAALPPDLKRAVRRLGETALSTFRAAEERVGRAADEYIQGDPAYREPGHEDKPDKAR